MRLISAVNDRVQELVRSVVYAAPRRRVLDDIRSVRAKDFTLLSSNCLAGLVYQTLNKPYLTPTVGLFFYAPCFVKFAGRPGEYLSRPLTFTRASKYADPLYTSSSRPYPVGRLGDVEIHFLHYRNDAEAAEKWQRRAARIDPAKTFLMFTDRDLCTEKELWEFDALPGRKVCFTAKAYPGMKSCCVVPAFAGQDCVGDLTTHFHQLDGVFRFRDFFSC